MDSKRRVRRFNVMMALAMLFPMISLLVVTMLATELNWPTWTMYVASGVFVAVSLIFSRYVNQGMRSLMHELPVRDIETPYNPNSPTVSPIELERFDRVTSALDSRKGKTLQHLTLGIVGIAAVGSLFMSSKWSLAVTLLFLGFAVMTAERALAFGKRRIDQLQRESQYWPRWWIVFAPATTALQWLTIAAFLAVSVFAVFAIYWLGVPFAIGGISGWLTSRYGFARFEQRVLAADNAALS